MYFTNCKTLAVLKTEYRNLCKKYHPDNPNGDAEIMKVINAEFDRLFPILKAKEKKANSTNNTEFDWEDSFTSEKKKTKVEETPEMFREIIYKLFSISDDIIIEICGSWLWLTGSTYQVKEQLKAIGCRWSKSKKKWYFTYEPYMYTRYTISEQARRFKYGSEFVEANKYQKLHD